MAPGALVMTTHEIHTVPTEAEENYAGDPSLSPGTVGIIIERPSVNRPRQYLIAFVGGRTYWMYANEIQPYIKR